MQEPIRFASAGDDIKIWDFNFAIVEAQFNPHCSTSEISSVCWSMNNEFLASADCCGDRIVVSSCESKWGRQFDLAQGKKQTCLDLHSDFKYLVSGGHDNSVNIWDLNSRRLHRSHKDHKDEVTCVRVNKKDNCIASGSRSGAIILHSVAVNVSSARFGNGSTQPVQALSYSAHENTLLGSVSTSGTVALWDVNSRNCYHEFHQIHTAPVSGIVFSPTNHMLFVTVGLDRRILFCDVTEKKPFQTQIVDSPLTAVDFHPDGYGLIAGCVQGMIYQFDLRKMGGPLRKVGAHKSSVHSIQFQHCSPDVKLWDVSTSRTPSLYLDKQVARRRNSCVGRIQHSGTDTCCRNNLDLKPSKELGAIKNDLIASCKSSVVDMFSPVRGDVPVSELEDVFVSEKDNMCRRHIPDVTPWKERVLTELVDPEMSNASRKRSFIDLFSPVRDGTAQETQFESERKRKWGSIHDDETPQELSKLSKFTFDMGSRSSLEVTPVKKRDFTKYSDLNFHNKSWSSKFEHMLSPNRDSMSCRTSLHVTPSTETDLAKCADFNFYNVSRRSSLGDLFSPVRDGGGMHRHLIEDRHSSSPIQPSYELPQVWGASPLSSRRASHPGSELRLNVKRPGLKLTSPATAGVNDSLSERRTETIAGYRTSAPLTSIQINVIRSMVHEMVDDFREYCHRSYVHLQVEMIRQFHIQLNEIQLLLTAHSVNGSLMAEIKKLDEENKRLRTFFLQHFH